MATVKPKTTKVANAKVAKKVPRKSRRVFSFIEQCLGALLVLNVVQIVLGC